MKPRETDGPDEVHFHYNREERETGLSEFAKRNLHTKGFFRRNRSLVITLIDLSVLVLLFFIIFFYLKITGVSSSGIEGISLETDAYLLGNRVYVTMVFERTEADGPTGAIRVFFRALPSDSREDVSGVLPSFIGEVRTIRAAMTAEESEVKVFATVDFETGSKVYEIEVRARETQR